jgi:hypothetical protein
MFSFSIVLKYFIQFKKPNTKQIIPKKEKLNAPLKCYDSNKCVYIVVEDKMIALYMTNNTLIKQKHIPRGFYISESSGIVIRRDKLDFYKSKFE